LQPVSFGAKRHTLVSSLSDAEGPMKRLLDQALSNLRSVAADLEPERLVPGDATVLIERVAEIEKTASGLKLLLAARLADSGVWHDEGHRSAASWLAQRSGTSLGHAIRTIETAKKMSGLERTTEALKKGELSAEEAAQVTQAASLEPKEEKKLLDTASEHSMKRLTEHSRRVQTAAFAKEDEAARYEAIERRRYLRHRSDPEGAFHLEARLSPDKGARLLSRLELRADSFFEEARKKNEHEPQEAYLADALVSLVLGEPEAKVKGGRGKDEVVVHVDAAALRRGYKRTGEHCEISGVGPVSVASARRILGDAFLKFVIEDSVDVLSVCHVGRSVPAHLQSALEARDRTCVVPGCAVSHGLENHHWGETFAECGTSNLAGLARVCSYHHDLISYRGYELTGGSGNWKLLRPPQRSPDRNDPIKRFNGPGP
jgi:polyhydroxyalkanoate synthesis regulator phasin